MVDRKEKYTPSSEREADFYLRRVSASEEVFASRAELCSVNFSLSPLLWNYEITVKGLK